jgi:hypothetical protein
VRRQLYITSIGYLHSITLALKPEPSTKDILKLTGRSILTLTKKLPDIVDGNPVKVALGLVKLIVEIQQV